MLDALGQTAAHAWRCGSAAVDLASVRTEDGVACATDEALERFEARSNAEDRLRAAKKLLRAKKREGTGAVVVVEGTCEESCDERATALEQLALEQDYEAVATPLVLVLVEAASGRDGARDVRESGVQHSTVEFLGFAAAARVGRDGCPFGILSRRSVYDLSLESLLWKANGERDALMRTLGEMFFFQNIKVFEKRHFEPSRCSREFVYTWGPKTF